MRILMVGSGGIAMRRPLEWALEQGHQVLLVASADPYSPDNTYNIKEAPTNYHFVPFFAAKINSEQGGYNLLKSVKEFTHQWRSWVGGWQLRWLTLRFQPDVIHVHAINWRSECCALAGLHPLVVSAWGFLNYLLDPKLEPRYIERLPATHNTLKGTDALIVETPNLVDKCEALLKPSQQVKLIPLGTNTQRFCPPTLKKVARARKALGIPLEAKVFLSPRGWSNIYGHHHILKAYALAQSKFEQPTALVFVRLGRAGNWQEIIELENRICNQAEEWKIADKIHFLPQLPFEMMPSIYSVADVIVNYPYTDAFPSTLMEVFACERAVISSNLPAYRGTFIEKFCTLVEPENPTALAEAMVKVINTPMEKQAPYLTQARQVIIEQYEEKVARKQLHELYQQLGANKVRNGLAKAMHQFFV